MLTFADFLNSEEFNIYLYNTNVEFQLICCTETWSKSYNEDGVRFNGFIKSVVVYRHGVLVGGGVALLMKDNIECEPLIKEKFMPFTCFTSFEFLSVKVF